MADCGCGGGSAAVAASASAGVVWTIQLANGTKVGSFPTEDHGRVALQTTYAGNGKVIRK